MQLVANLLASLFPSVRHLRVILLRDIPTSVCPRASPLAAAPAPAPAALQALAMSLHGNSATISKLARIIMKDGKLHLSLRIIDSALQHLRQAHAIQHPARFAERAIERARPVVELRKYKVSGRALQIPTPCRPARQMSLALRFVRYVFIFFFRGDSAACPCGRRAGRGSGREGGCGLCGADAGCVMFVFCFVSICCLFRAFFAFFWCGVFTWHSDAFRERKERGAGLRLANELVDLERGAGGAWRRREELHRRAEQNRAFAHFAR